MASNLSIIRVLLELRRLRTHDKWNAEQVTEHQKRSLNALRKHAMQHSSFYQEFYKGLENAPLEELPPLTKSTMMEHFDNFVTDRNVNIAEVKRHLEATDGQKFQGKYEVVTTSGSTGNPGIFLFDPQEWTTILASFARAREWAGLKVNMTRPSKMAVVSSTNERNISAKVGRAVNTRFVPTLRIDATEPMETIVEKLNQWKPESIVGYASMAYFLAIEQQKGRLNIRPRFIFTASEVLTPEMRQTIESVWGKVVYNDYVSTETATIAAEDTHHHGLHVSEDLLIVENVDKNNRPVKPGVYGEKLLVTVLFSHTQPLIRYEISDNVRFAEGSVPCNLAYSIIDGVEGRQQDILLMPGTVVPEISVHPNVFHDLMLSVPNKGWQVIQEKDYLRVLLIDPEENPAIIRGRIADALRKQGVKVPDIEMELVASIPKEKSGKSPLVKKYKKTVV